MKIIDKNNFWNVYCMAFTYIALGATTIDIFAYKSVNFTQFNILMIAAGCLIGVLIFSASPYLEAFSPLSVIILQYAAAIMCALLLTWLTGFWEPISPHGYRDMIISFSVPYFIGAVIYNIKLKKEIKGQNEELQIIKKLIKEHPGNMQ